MITVSLSTRILRLACALALLGIPVLGSSQAVRAVRPATQPTAPSGITPGVAGPGVPSPNGLASPLPNPAGLNSQFPAGLPSPLPNPAGLPSPTVPNLASPGSPSDTASVDNGLVVPGNTMGAGGYGGTGAAAAGRRAPGATAYSAVQIAQSFIGADANRDGELTRVEAQRLTIMPFSFEDMDLNHDGVVTRSEYEESLR